MEINVKVATILLKKADPPLESSMFPLTVEDDIRVQGLVEMLGIPVALVGSITINKRRKPLDTRLAEGDNVAIIPAISGG
ncbi:MAG: MoaD/ThiS family protein [Candidatus Geothermincolia bacterium]